MISLPPLHRFGLVVLILALTLPPPLARWWEGDMLRHMLAQIPLLVLAGVLLAPRLAHGAARDQMAGIAAVLAAGFCLGFWMLPRWFDAAVSHAGVDAAKAVTLVLLAGLPLGWGWPRLGPVARGVVWVHLVGMLAVLGVLYLGFPARLCNNYLEGDQVRLGRAMLLIAGLISAWIAGRVMVVGVNPAARS